MFASTLKALVPRGGLLTFAVAIQIQVTIRCRITNPKKKAINSTGTSHHE